MVQVIQKHPNVRVDYPTHRRLYPGEVVQQGDQYQRPDGCWISCDILVGNKVRKDSSCPVRRELLPVIPGSFLHIYGRKYVVLKATETLPVVEHAHFLETPTLKLELRECPI